MNAQVQTLTFCTIESELQELLTLRETAESEGAIPEELQAIDRQIEQYFEREVRKVDGIANAIHIYEHAAEAAQEEAIRIMARAKTLQSTADRIRENALRTMQLFGVPRLDTPTNRLRVCGNGGKEPLEVSIPDAVPDQCRVFRLTFRLDTLLAIRSALGPGLMRDCLDDQIVSEPDNDAIRAALKQSIACPECKGEGAPWNNSAAVPCVRCNGSGTVPNTVPGARLLPRGEHLRVE